MTSGEPLSIDSSPRLPPAVICISVGYEGSFAPEAASIANTQLFFLLDVSLFRSSKKKLAFLSFDASGIL